MLGAVISETPVKVFLAVLKMRGVDMDKCCQNRAKREPWLVSTLEQHLRDE